MTSKENVFGLRPPLTMATVKSEPQEVTILRSSDMLNQTVPQYSGFVKQEPSVLEDSLKSQPLGSFRVSGVEDASDTAAHHTTPVSVSPEPVLFKVYESPVDIAFTAEGALKEGLGMVKTLRNSIQKLQLGARRQEVWQRDLNSLESQTSPKTLIAVCGGTGTGKSSLLNAVLDDNIVPTSGMRACTAVVTEISYHKKSTIEAEVSFLTESEWRNELTVLLTDLVDEEGNLKRISDLKSDAGVAWSKVNGVYPKLSQERLVTMTAEQIVTHDPKVAKILGTTKTIVAKDSKTFGKEIAKFIDSKDSDRGKKKKNKDDDDAKPKKSTSDPDAPALWPLIRMVNVKCSSKALSTGAILVDLPGVADANAARNEIAKRYMKNCNCIWVVAPITRAVDDKTARDLLGEAFRMQLLNGSYDDHTITFVATKCDDVSCSEVINAISLSDSEEEELRGIQERLDTANQDLKQQKKDKTDALKTVKSLDKELKTLRATIKEHQEHIDCLNTGEKFVPKLTAKKAVAAPGSKKRKNRSGGKKGSPKRARSEEGSEDEDSDHDSIFESSDGSDDDDDGNSEHGSDSESDEEQSVIDLVEDEDEDVTIESIEAKITELKSKLKETRASHTTARQAKKQAADAIARLTKSLTKAQREKNGFCSKRRSEFSKDVLREDFRTGLKELDDAAAEERDPDNFDPSVNQRDYDAIELPVFTVSSRDYTRLKGQVHGDGEPSCFSNVQDTGVPELQTWCRELTKPSRQRSVKNFFAHLSTFARSLQSYFEGVGDVTPQDRENLKSLWETAAPLDTEEYQNLDDPFSRILGGGSTLYSIKAESQESTNGVSNQLDKRFTEVISKTVGDLQTRFQDGLEDKCRVGATNAASTALETSDSFAGAMHWATYRATLRRHGTFHRDLNSELLSPFTKNIASSWGKIFESDLFQPFESGALGVIRKLLEEVENSAADGLKDRVKTQAELCFTEAEVALKKVIDVVRETMQSEQKEISRSMAPHVQAQLRDGYDTAMEEVGRGSVARQKAVFHNFVDECKDDMFEDGVDIIMEQLQGACSKIGTALTESLRQISDKVEVNLSILWEGSAEDRDQLTTRFKILSVVSKVMEQISHWVAASATPETPADVAMA